MVEREGGLNAMVGAPLPKLVPAPVIPLERLRRLLLRLCPKLENALAMETETSDPNRCRSSSSSSSSTSSMHGGGPLQCLLRRLDLGYERDDSDASFGGSHTTGGLRRFANDERALGNGGTNHRGFGGSHSSGVGCARYS